MWKSSKFGKWEFRHAHWDTYTHTMHLMSTHLPLASLTRVHTAGAWPYRVLQSVILSTWSSWGCVGRFKPHWMFQIYKYVIESREEFTSCSSLIHSHMFPLLDVLYRQVGNLSFGQWREHNDISVRFWASVYHTNGSKQAMLSASCQPLVKGSLIGRSCDARHSRYLAILNSGTLCSIKQGIALRARG